jgi:hypothetical protein
MREMRQTLLQIPGCIDVDPPYLVDHDGECLVGISKWESREAFVASGFVMRAPDEIVQGETRPRQRFVLEEVPPRPQHPEIGVFGGRRSA